MPEIKVTAEANLQPVVKGLQQVQTELGKTAIAANKMDSSLMTASKNLPLIGNKAGIAASALSGIGDAAGGAVGGITSLGSALLSGGIIVAIPLIITGLSALGEALFGVSKAEQALIDTLASGKAEFAKADSTVNKLTVDINLAKEGFISKDDVVKEYNKTIGKTTGVVKTLEEAEQALIKNGPAYIQFTLLKAQANYAFGKSAEASVKALEIAAQKSQFAGKFGLLNNAIADKFDKVTKEAEDQAKIFKDIATTAETLAARVSKSNNFNFLGDDVADKETKVKAATQKVVRHIRDISDVISDLRKEISFLNTKEIQLHTDEAKGKISALEGAIKELITKFGKPGKENTIRLFAEIRELQLLESLRKSLTTTVKGEEFKVEPIITVDPVIKRGDFEDRLAEFLFNKAAFQKKVDEFQSLVAGSLAQIGSGALAGLGDAIGSALGGKGDAIKGLFDSIFTSVGDQLQQLGKFLIKTGIEIKIAKEAFKKLLASPVASIAVGIGLVALGALLKNAVANKPQGFASGSTSTPGGTFLVGERGPERIFLPQGSRVQPNNELQAYGGNSQPIVLEHRISGMDIVIVGNRARASMNRSGGVASY